MDMFKSICLVLPVFGLCVATTVPASAAAMPRHGSTASSALTPSCGDDGAKKSVAEPSCGDDGAKKSVAEPSCGDDGAKKSVAETG